MGINKFTLSVFSVTVINYDDDLVKLLNSMSGMLKPDKCVIELRPFNESLPGSRGYVLVEFMSNMGTVSSLSFQYVNVGNQ